MRTEATMEELKKVYESTSRIQKLEPWELLQDMEIIGIQADKDPENTVFYSILRKGGDCYGISVYKEYDAFNSFVMLTMQERMNLSVEYAMFNQHNLTCCWGNREELSAKQRKIIKTLGYKYRGKNNRLYFMSYEPGYCPYNLNQNEVLRMTELLGELSRGKKGKYTLEANGRPMGAALSDKKYDKPANPAMSILTEANTGMVISCDMNGRTKMPLV